MTVFGNVFLTSRNFLRFFTSIFYVYVVLVSIEKIYQILWRECFITFPNTFKFVRNTPLCVVFSTPASPYLKLGGNTISRAWYITSRTDSCPVASQWENWSEKDQRRETSSPSLFFSVPSFPAPSQFSHKRRLRTSQLQESFCTRCDAKRDWEWVRGASAGHPITPLFPDWYLACELVALLLAASLS